MIHPTRSDLLQLKQKDASIVNSVAILKARRQALIRSFLDSLRPFIRSRDGIRDDYARALTEIHLSEGHDGMPAIESAAATAARDVGVTVEQRNVLGVHYRDLTIYGPLVRSPAERNYGYTLTSPHLEESIYRFESIVGSLLEIAAFESKIKMLGRQITRVTRTTRVLEERVLPALRAEIRTILAYIAERERETNFRLRRFKASHARLV
jgi:V/A-type H+-transporting ATPase subunit D